jgi:hypothetical protein
MLGSSRHAALAHATAPKGMTMRTSAEQFRRAHELSAALAQVPDPDRAVWAAAEAASAAAVTGSARLRKELKAIPAHAAAWAHTAAGRELRAIVASAA